jgi:hypothetical protein
MCKMNEGWDDYLILFDELEVATMTERYALSQFLPGYQVLGLRGWDDFIVCDSQGRTFSIPTVPLELKYLSPFAVPEGMENGGPSSRRAFPRQDKMVFEAHFVRWGSQCQRKHEVGEPGEHAQPVRWWNDLHRSLTNKGPAAPKA